MAMDGALLGAYITAGGIILGGAFGIARGLAHGFVADEVQSKTQYAVTRDQLRAALAEFKVDLITTLNGTYMRTTLVEGHLRNIHTRLSENREDLKELSKEIHAH